MVEASLKELQTFSDPSVHLSTGPQDDAKNNRGPPRLSYAGSRAETTVLHLSQVPWLERRTSPPPMVSGSVFVVNAKIIPQSAVFQRWNVTVSCSRWLTLAHTVRRQAPAPQSGRGLFNKSLPPLESPCQCPCAPPWLPPEIKHSFWLPFSTWRESRAVLRSECSRPPPALPLLSPITDTDSGKDKKPETIQFKIATRGGRKSKEATIKSSPGRAGN